MAEITVICRQIPVKGRALPHIGPDPVKIGSPDGLRHYVVRGTSARQTRETGEEPMNVRSEKIELTEEDPNLAAVSEVEAGIRDFVRNDVAYLRRPNVAGSAETALLSTSAVGSTCSERMVAFIGFSLMFAFKRARTSPARRK